MAEIRAVLFVDGNNWYHALKEAGVVDRFMLDYVAISEKLTKPRTWIGTRYYLGALKQDWNPTDYENQRRFLSQLQQQDGRISVHLGRLERRPVDNPMVGELRQMLEAYRSDIPREVRNEFFRLAYRHATVETLKEKAVDVMLAVDMYKLAVQNDLDAAYLLSADGDFTPPVRALRDMGKAVYAVAPRPAYSSELAQVANAFLPLEPGWFKDCYREAVPEAPLPPD